MKKGRKWRKRNETRRKAKEGSKKGEIIKKKIRSKGNGEEMRIRNRNGRRT